MKDFHLATLKDLPKIMKFVEEENMDVDIGISEVLPKSLPRMLSWFKQDIESGAIVLYQKHGIIRGIMDLTFSTLWWSDSLIVTNRLFYIAPKERSFSLYRKFLKMAKEIAKQKDLPFIFGLFDGKDFMRKEKLMRGSKKIGGFYVFSSRRG